MNHAARVVVAEGTVSVFCYCLNLSLIYSFAGLKNLYFFFWISENNNFGLFFIILDPKQAQTHYTQHRPLTTPLPP